MYKKKRRYYKFKINAHTRNLAVFTTKLKILTHKSSVNA